MALADDINALPTTLADGHTGHLANHQTIHDAVKDHQGRITEVEGRIPSSLALTLDTSVGTRVMAGNRLLMGETGFLDFTSLLSLAPNGGTLYIERTTKFVTVAFDYLYYSPGVSATAQIPVGFRPARQSSGTIQKANGETTGRWQFLSGGKLTLWWEQNNSAISHFTLPARADWPTTLTVGGA